MRLYRLGQLPASVAALEGEDAEAAAMRLPRLATSRSAASAPSLLSRAFLRCGSTSERTHKMCMLRQNAGPEAASFSQAHSEPLCPALVNSLSALLRIMRS